MLQGSKCYALCGPVFLCSFLSNGLKCFAFIGKNKTHSTNKKEHFVASHLPLLKALLVQKAEIAALQINKINIKGKK